MYWCTHTIRGTQLLNYIWFHKLTQIELVSAERALHVWMPLELYW